MIIRWTEFICHVICCVFGPHRSSNNDQTSLNEPNALDVKAPPTNPSLSLSCTHNHTMFTPGRIHLTVLCLTHRLFCLYVSSGSEGAFLQEDTARLHTAALRLLLLLLFTHPPLLLFILTGPPVFIPEYPEYNSVTKTDQRNLKWDILTFSFCLPSFSSRLPLAVQAHKGLRGHYNFGTKRYKALKVSSKNF